MAQKQHPMMFIHGLWLHSSSRAEWQSYFTAAGYVTSAPGWPGDQDTVDAALRQSRKCRQHRHR